MLTTFMSGNKADKNMKDDFLYIDTYILCKYHKGNILSSKPRMFWTLQYTDQKGKCTNFVSKNNNEMIKMHWPFLNKSNKIYCQRGCSPITVCFFIQILVLPSWRRFFNPPFIPTQLFLNLLDSLRLLFPRCFKCF